MLFDENDECDCLFLVFKKKNLFLKIMNLAKRLKI